MAGRFQHPRQKAADLHDVALGHAQIDICDLCGLVMGADHPRSILLLQLGDTADMIAVMMGDKNIGQSPALALQHLDDGRGLWRIDRGCGLGRRVMDQIPEIVGETGEDANFGSHAISMLQWAMRARP